MSISLINYINILNTKGCLNRTTKLIRSMFPNYFLLDGIMVLAKAAIFKIPVVAFCQLFCHQYHVGHVINVYNMANVMLA